MSDEIEAVTEGAKAVQEVAKTGRALVEAGSDLARFIGKALGTAAEDTVGLLGGDYLHELRLRNLDKISRKTEEILRKRGIEEPEPIGPKALLPALEAASEETDETLQDMWASLLANAMDPNTDTTLRQIFINTLKQFEPIDAVILQEIVRANRSFVLGHGKKKIRSVDIITKLHVRSTEFQLSALHLDKLDCIELSDTMSVGGEEFSSGMEPTALGIELYLACTGDAPN